MNQFVEVAGGHAAYECGQCHKVETFFVFKVSSTYLGPQMCWCEGPAVAHQMYPINDLAKSNDEFRDRLHREEIGKARARKFMQEVNW